MTTATAEFTPAVFEQFEEVRASGFCNMLDRTCVGGVALNEGRLDLYAACDLGNRRSRKYSNLLQAFSGWKRAQEEGRAV